MPKKRGKAAKKALAGNLETKALEEQLARAPHSFVFHRGLVGSHIRELIKDIRRVMEPFTASRLQVRKSNTLKDLTSIAGLFHVTRLLMFTKTDCAPYLRVIASPQGPTLVFKIHEYCLARDVVSHLNRPNVEQSAFMTSPLLVMNNISGEQLELKLVQAMFQEMFPKINVHKVNLNSVRRCVLINYHKDTKLLDFRHYLIKLTPVGISRGIKKLIKPKLPNMSRFQTIGEYLEKGGNLSESEGEMDGPHNEVTLPQEVRGRGNIKATQSAVRLKEVGPRLTLQLVKIEEGVCDGAVLFHEFVHKSAEEQKSIRAMREKKRRLKEKRKKEQLANIKRKAALKEEHKKKSLQGMKLKQATTEKPASGNQAESDSDDDAKYYQEVLGEKPAEDLFPDSKGKKRKTSESKQANVPVKKIKRQKHSPGQFKKRLQGVEKKRKMLAGKKILKSGRR